LVETLIVVGVIVVSLSYTTKRVKL